jgi:hypothetical protein
MESSNALPKNVPPADQPRPCCVRQVQTLSRKPSLGPDGGDHQPPSPVKRSSGNGLLHDELSKHTDVATLFASQQDGIMLQEYQPLPTNTARTTSGI